jgi:hypothetical protein
MALGLRKIAINIELKFDTQIYHGNFEKFLLFAVSIHAQNKGF